jgi:hypothetical protein
MSPNVIRHALVLVVATTALLGAAAPAAIATVDTTGPVDATVDAPAASDVAAASTASDVAAASGSNGSTDATLSVGSANASTGETVTVPVVATGENVAGYQANLTWDPSVLRFESVSGANLSDPVTNQGSGWVFATQSQSDGVDSPTLARVTFTVVGDAGDETTMAFEPRDAAVNNQSAQLDTALESGTVSVDASADVDGDDETAARSESDGGDGDGNDGGDDGVSPTLLVGGIAGAGGVLGAGYLLGQRGGGGGDGGSE